MEVPRHETFPVNHGVDDSALDAIDCMKRRHRHGANGLLAREYRKPFVVLSEREIG
jgi:hypothetical protein